MVKMYVSAEQAAKMRAASELLDGGKTYVSVSEYPTLVDVQRLQRLCWLRQNEPPQPLPISRQGEEGALLYSSRDVAAYARWRQAWEREIHGR
jgi:hypothetical protein